MIKTGIKSRKLLIASIGIALILVAAASYLFRIEQQQAGDVRILVDEGIAQFREDKYELSLQTLGSIPENFVKDWRIPYYMGSAQVKLKDYQSGALQLEEALALNKNEENILFALGVAYYKLGNLSLSKAYFSAVLEIDPGNEEARGLMDIMANLERQQPGNAKPVTKALETGVTSSRNGSDDQ